MKKERGAITVLTLVTVLFIISFLVSTFVVILNRRQAQAEIKRKTQEIYETKVGQEEQIYKNYFADENEVIPIYNVEQLFNIGTNKLMVSNNKIYKYRADANYKLAGNIEFNVVDYETEYQDVFEQTSKTILEKSTVELKDQVSNFSNPNSTTNEYYTYDALGTGTYKLEVWGANGGSYNTSTSADGKGGTGGYSVGTITLDQGDILYVYVGGAGSYSTTTTYTATSAGGYNGGGNVGYRGGSGGGATDIRILGTSLYNRVIVAGGGGGGYYYSTTYKATGGNGGGTSGSSGGYYSSSYTAFIGGGATQTAGGSGGTGSSSTYNGNAGTFGVGGNTGYKRNNTSYYSNGAGRRRLVWRRSCRKL